MIAFMATDGSAVADKMTGVDNSYISAGGYIISVFEKNEHLYDLEDTKYLGRTNSQEAEISGLIFGLEAIILNGIDKKCPVIIILDNDYIIRYLSMLSDKWSLDLTITKKAKTTVSGNFRYLDLLAKAHSLFYSLENGGLILKIKSHVSDKKTAEAYEKFKIVNGYLCSFGLFMKFKELNEKVDSNVGIVTRYIKRRNENVYC